MSKCEKLIDKLKIIKLYLEHEKKADMAHTIGKAIEALQDAPKSVRACKEFEEREA